MTNRGWEPGDVRPHDVIRETGRWSPAIITTIIVVGGAVIGGVFLLIMLFQPWAHHVQDSEARHQGVIASISASVYQNNPGTQQARIDEMENAISDIPGADPANAMFDGRLACKDAAQINQIPPGDRQWVDDHCVGSVYQP